MLLKIDKSASNYLAINPPIYIYLHIYNDTESAIHTSRSPGCLILPLLQDILGFSKYSYLYVYYPSSTR